MFLSAVFQVFQLFCVLGGGLLGGYERRYLDKKCSLSVIRRVLPPCKAVVTSKGSGKPSL